MQKPVARYFRLSKQEADRDAYAVVRQHYQLEQACIQMGDDPPNPDYLFADMQSGRDDDRPDFERLVKAIRSRDLRAVAITRVDRISRNVEMNARLANLFQDTGVLCHEVMLGRTYNFNDPADWENFVNKGVRAESESRMLAARIRATTTFMRHMGQVCGGKTSLGYKRGEHKRYTPNPDTWDIAHAVVDRFIETESALMVSRWLKLEHNVDWSYQAITRWLLNPLLRGHTVYFWQLHPSQSNPPQDCVVKYNTHPALIDQSTAEKIDLILNSNKGRRGKKSNQIYPLSGKMRCAVCGATCTLSSNRIICSNRRSGKADTPCGLLVNDARFKGRNQWSDTPGIAANRELVEDTVLIALANRAAEIVTLMLQERSDELSQPEILHPDELKRRSQITRLQSLIDDIGDESGLLRQKIAELSMVSRPSTSATQEIEMREALIQVGSDVETWREFDPKDRLMLFRRFVDLVLLNGTEIIEVRLKV